MNTTKERKQQIADLRQEGWPLADVWTLLRYAATLNRLAELSCSSEAADRDRVPCPGAKGRRCLCDAPTGAPDARDHERIPRIDVQAARIEERVRALAAKNGATVNLSGDPRGYVVKLHLPSGRYNTWGGPESGYGVG